MRETFTFELILHYEPEYTGTVLGLKQEIRRALKVMGDVYDVELELIERETQKEEDEHGNDHLG